MFQRIFNPDNLFFRSCGKVFDLVVLSALWLFLCLPVVTIGPATAALYYSVVKCIRRGERDPYKNFFRSFRENFKVGAVSGVITVVAIAFLWVGWLILTVSGPGGDVGGFLRTAYTVALVIPLGVAVYLFPLLSRFTFGVGGLFLNALKLAVRHLPSTAVVVLLNVEMVSLSLKYLVPLFVSPALTALVASLFFERIFKKITPAAAPAADHEPAPAPAHPSMDDVTEEPPEEETPWYLK